MLDRLLSILAPHYCSGCGNQGGLLCGNCKYDIISDMTAGCVVCGAPAAADGICGSCRTHYDRAWLIGERKGSLQRLIGLYKFERARAGHEALADLLHAALPQLPADAVVVPVPTLPAHIRQRGYDHMWLIARRFARLRGLPVQRQLVRTSTTVQRGATAKVRRQQAKDAFGHVGTVSAGVPYVLIDDVMTTGATIEYAAKELRAAGAAQVWVAVIARQTLD